METNMNNLEGFKVLITGASSGLGFEMAKALLGEGALVAVASRPGEKLDKSIENLKNLGFNPLKLGMDVRDEESVKNAVGVVKEKFQGLDMLVNNAGLGKGRVLSSEGKEIPFWEMETEAFRDVIDTNLTGYFIVAKHFVPLMISNRRGRIVNVSTSPSTMKMVGQIPYGPSRAGSTALSEIMAKELAEYGISVNVLIPGGAADTGLVPESMREVFKKIGLLPADIMNNSILFLASPYAAGLSEETIIAKELDFFLEKHEIPNSIEKWFEK
jgi:gluconate 5-dehydrogenase